MMARAGYFVATLILSLGFGSQNSMATPVLGQQFYYEGGSIEVKVLPLDASYTDRLYLFSTSSPLLIANNVEVGKVVNLTNLPSLGVAVGDELIFGIFVTNTGNTFQMGPASRNADNVLHATVDYSDNPSGDVALLSFEDLFGGGDKDFNDANFQISGGVGIAPPRIPEPASAILLIFGATVIACLSRRRKNQLQVVSRSSNRALA